MRRLLTFLRSHRAANGIEYAVLVGLVALVSIGAVVASGGQIRDLFGGAGGELAVVPGVEDSEDGGGDPADGGDAGGPAVTLTSSHTTLAYGETATLSWTTTDAQSVSAAYTLSGACATLAADGAGPHALPWADLAGSQTMTWTEDGAGCAYEICLEATNAEGATTDCVAVAVAERDTTPNSFAFAAAADEVPAAESVSEPVTLAGFDGALDFAVAGGTAELNGSGAWAATGAVTEGDSLRLKTTAPADFESSKAVSLTVGSATATWTVAVGPEDATPDAVAFPDGLGDPGAIAASAVVTPTGFNTPIAVAVVGSDPTHKLRVRRNGVWGPWATSDTLNPRDALQLQAQAPAAVGDSTTMTVDVGGVQATWTLTAAETFVTFAEPGSHSWTVPAGVTEIDVALWGGGGGGTMLAAGGGATAATATVAVAPGETLTVWVGGAGGHGYGSTGGAAQSVGGVGFRPGGDGGGGTYFGGGGGGASAILIDAEAIVVAGGGGGGTWGGAGGAGRGASGENGKSYDCGGGGRGATQVAHGGGGSGAIPGNPGTDSGGGDGVIYLDSAGSGGGGGGWFSGGSGGVCNTGRGGGGGGSSYINGSFATGNLFPANGSNPYSSHSAYVTGVGRGGSGAGFSSGNGYVYIDY